MGSVKRIYGLISALLIKPVLILIPVTAESRRIAYSLPVDLKILNKASLIFESLGV